MGVSGSGKSTVGQLLSDRTGWDFYDADHFHTPDNIAKMTRGIPLTDLDREPWLIRLQELIDRTLAAQKSAILACSALKTSYREILQNNHQDLVWIYLKGDYQAISTRIKQRTGHFLPAELLRDQFDTLEEPQNAVIIDVSLPPSVIVDRIINLNSV
jgi:gluconokinase